MRILQQRTITNGPLHRFITEEQMSTVTTSELSGTPLAQEFEDIFNTHAQLVYRTAYAVTGNHEDAEHILQTIFLRLIRPPLAPELTDNPKAYLYRAAVNLSLDTIRSRRRP